MQPLYDYEWAGNGLVITDRNGRSCFLQGESAAELYDELSTISRPWVCQLVLAAYSKIMR